MRYRQLFAAAEVSRPASNEKPDLTKQEAYIAVLSWSIKQSITYVWQQYVVEMGNGSRPPVGRLAGRQ
jgi:hypothetical protein